MKAILLVRVSTSVQELDEQERELYQLAIKEGYKPEDIIPICEKESGIKLSEEERLGLNRLKEVVDNEQVKDVFIWEVSRLARTKKVLFSMQDYFVSRKIQVTFKEPTYFKLLNNDGSVNDAADMVFTIYAQMAESEMRTKQARFKRAKKQMAEEGRWSGGSTLPPYGYKLGEGGYYAINEEEAAVVQLIFKLYTTKKIGAKRLANELRERGYEFPTYRIRQILCCEKYTGSAVLVSGYKRKYPVIISKELWDKAVACRSANTINDKSKGRQYFLGSSLIRCPECGCHFALIRSSHGCQYGCYRHFSAYKKENNVDCSNSLAVSNKILDYLLWLVAKRKKIENLFLNKEESKEALEREISSLVMKIEGYQRNALTAKNKRERLADLYIDGAISKANYEKKLASFNATLEDYEREITALRDRIKLIQSKINATDIADLEEYAKNIDTISQKEKYDIVHEVITDVKFELVPEEGRKAKIITIYTGKEFNSFLYTPYSHKIAVQLIKANKRRSTLLTKEQVASL